MTSGDQVPSYKTRTRPLELIIVCVVKMGSIKKLATLTMNEALISALSILDDGRAGRMYVTISSLLVEGGGKGGAK